MVHRQQDFLFPPLVIAILTLCKKHVGLAKRAPQSAVFLHKGKAPSFVKRFYTQGSEQNATQAKKEELEREENSLSPSLPLLSDPAQFTQKPLCAGAMCWRISEKIQSCTEQESLGGTAFEKSVSKSYLTFKVQKVLQFC